MRRREFLIGAAAGIAAFPSLAATPFRGDMWPPLNGKAAFVEWMLKNRGGEDAVLLGERFDRYQQLIPIGDLWTPTDKRAFLMTPREEFVLLKIARKPMSAIISTSALASRSPRPALSGG